MNGGECESETCECKWVFAVGGGGGGGINLRGSIWLRGEFGDKLWGR